MEVFSSLGESDEVSSFDQISWLGFVYCPSSVCRGYPLVVAAFSRLQNPLKRVTTNVAFVTLTVAGGRSLHSFLKSGRSISRSWRAYERSRSLFDYIGCVDDADNSEFYEL